MEKIILKQFYAFLEVKTIDFSYEIQYSNGYKIFCCRPIVDGNFSQITVFVYLILSTKDIQILGFQLHTNLSTFYSSSGSLSPQRESGAKRNVED